MRNYGTGRLSSRPNVSGCSDRCCMTKRAGAFGSEIEEEDYGARKRLRLDEGPPHVSRHVWRLTPSSSASRQVAVPLVRQQHDAAAGDDLLRGAVCADPRLNKLLLLGFQLEDHHAVSTPHGNQTV